MQRDVLVRLCIVAVLFAMIGAGFSRTTEKSPLVEEKKVAEESETRLKFDHEQQLSADVPAGVALRFQLCSSRLAAFSVTPIDAAVIDCERQRGPPAC